MGFPPAAQKTNKWQMNCREMQSFCQSSEGVIHSMGEDLCSYVSDRGLVSRIYKALKKHLESKQSY